MPAGLECFADDGTVLVSITDRVTKILGTVNTNLSNGSLNVADFSKGRPWFRAVAFTTGIANETPATVTRSGNILSWYYPSDSTAPPNTTFRNTKIIYGIY